MTANNVVQLPEVTSIVMGQSPPGDTYNERGEGLPFFQGKAEFGELNPTPKKWCSAPQRTAEPGDILMSVRAPVGPTNVAAARCCIGRGLAAIRADASKLHPDYLRFFLRHSEPHLARMGQGSTFAAIGRAEIADLQIPLPHLDDQRHIVDLLSRAEGLVQLRREAQKKASDIVPALFLDIFGDPATNPKGWPITPLGVHLDFITSGSRGWAQHYAQTGARFIRSLDVRMNSIADDDAVYVTPPGGAETERTRVHAGDVLLTITGSQIGRVAPVGPPLAGAFISQHVAILRLQPGLSPAFLSLYLSLGMGGQREISRLQYGQTKPGLNFQQIRQFLVPSPPPDLQQAFMGRIEILNSIMRQQNLAAKGAEVALRALIARVFSNNYQVTKIVQEMRLRHE